MAQRRRILVAIQARTAIQETEQTKEEASGTGRLPITVRILRVPCKGGWQIAPAIAAVHGKGGMSLTYPLAVQYGNVFHPLQEVAMAPTIQELGLDRLHAEDRLAVAEAIWDSVAREVEAAPLSAGQLAELERRLADSIARPEAVTPWEVIKAKALARARCWSRL